MFPNNYLHFGKFRDLNFDEESVEFSDILSKSTSEQDFQRYIKENKKWFIPGSIFLDYNFGHHDAYLFPEQKLGTDYIADYMLIGKNSDGYSIVLVEFEDGNTDFILKSSNTEAESVRKGITQIRDWKRWMDSNKDFFMKKCGLYSYSIDSSSSNSNKSSGSTSKSSTSNSGSSSSYNNKSNSTNKSSYSSGTKKSTTTKKSTYDSYDDGYDDIYMDGDYDYDRYDRDSDYADGVDDAMDEYGEDW